MSQSVRLRSRFLLLDVESGATALARRLELGELVDLVIRGRIDRVWGHHDGVSQEFSVDVRSVEATLSDK